MPIGFVIGLASVLAAWALGYTDVLMSVGRDLGNGLDSFALLAIPFFILAGDLMGAGGMARRLIDFADRAHRASAGRTRLVNTLTCMLFGAISGSSAAAVSSVGSTMIPEMTRAGYPRDFSIAVTVASATTGLLIPPSNVMIVYAVVAANVSVGALFMAGVVPGVLVGPRADGHLLRAQRARRLRPRRPRGPRPPLVRATVRAIAEPVVDRVRPRRDPWRRFHGHRGLRRRRALGVPARRRVLPGDSVERASRASWWDRPEPPPS